MGKDKTVVVDLTNKFLSKDRKMTHHHQYANLLGSRCFSQLATRKTPVKLTDITLLKPIYTSGDFQPRIGKAGAYGPHWFDYYQMTEGQQWRDLTGNYTRYGDVKPLLLKAMTNISLPMQVMRYRWTLMHKICQIYQ